MQLEMDRPKCEIRGPVPAGGEPEARDESHGPCVRGPKRRPGSTTHPASPITHDPSPMTHIFSPFTPTPHSARESG
jgi:hypothetical protein